MIDGVGTGRRSFYYQKKCIGHNMKTYLPISIDITDKNILIVGGGNVAAHKIRILSQFRAHITVIALEIAPSLEEDPAIICLNKRYEGADLDGFCLIYACTKDPQLNGRICRDAREKNIFVNVADNPDLCDFISPALALYPDGMSVAVSSQGKDVKRSIKWRNKIKENIENDSTY